MPRLARNNIDIESYIERIFSPLNMRFISVNIFFIKIRSDMFSIRKYCISQKELKLLCIGVIMRTSDAGRSFYVVVYPEKVVWI